MGIFLDATDRNMSYYTDLASQGFEIIYIELPFHSILLNLIDRVFFINMYQTGKYIGRTGLLLKLIQYRELNGPDLLNDMLVPQYIDHVQTSQLYPHNICIRLRCTPMRVHRQQSTYAKFTNTFSLLWNVFSRV